MPDTVTLRPKSVALLFGAALLLGFGLGFALRRGSAEEPPTAVADAVESKARESAESSLSEATPDDPAAGPFSTDLSESPAEIAGEGRPFRGPADAPVTVVEFTDYECIFCRRHHRNTYPLLLAAYEGKLRYVVRNYPVKALHPRAMEAAQAAECAARQNKFWEYQDLLFQRGLSRASLNAHAAEVGLDPDRFSSCLDLKQTEATVKQDFADGHRFGVPGTPSFFINGRPLYGAQSIEVFQVVIDSILSAGETQ